MQRGGTIVVGLLGCGVVGSGVAERLLSGFSASGKPLALGSVLVRDLHKPRRPQSVASHLTTVPDRVLNDPSVDVVVECVGGIEPAGTFVETALRRGVPVITANKALLAKRGAELQSLAAQTGSSLRFEAAVAGATPVIRTLQHLARIDEVIEAGGILNGTTNFVLSAMEEGASYDDAIAAAQAAGYAEADPTLDVDGSDAAHKLCVLGAVAFGRWPRISSIVRRGIQNVTTEEIRQARSRGYRVRLTAWVRRNGENIIGAVGPTRIASHHPFACLRGAENAVLILTRNAGPILIGGTGAGREATASAVISDLHDLVAGAAAGAFDPLTSSQAREDNTLELAINL